MTRYPVEEAEVVARHAAAVLPLGVATLGDEYRYQSLPLCVIDAVYSIGVRYSGVQRVVARYCEFSGQRRVRVGTALPATSEQESISRFCEHYDQLDAAAMAESVFRNKQRTSARNGILKADAVDRFARCLRAVGVEYLQDVDRIFDHADFETAIKAIPGQGSGISLQYFWMLVGSDELIKPDRMVIRFLAAALSRDISPSEAGPLLRAACKLLLPLHPKLTPRVLDHEVWKYQRGTTA